MDLTQYPYKEQDSYPVPWGSYRFEESCLLIDNETLSDYQAYMAPVEYLKKAKDLHLWQLLVQDSIKDLMAVFLLEDFHKSEAIDACLKHTESLLSIYPDDKLTIGLKKSFQNSESPLSNAASLIKKWHLLPHKKHPGKEITIVLSEFSRPPSRTEDKNKLYYQQTLDEFSQKHQHFIKHLDRIILHGSYATSDFIPGSSDLDLVYIVSDDCLASTERLFQLRNELKGVTDYYFRIDPLQHHGPYIFSNKILSNFIESYLPLAIWNQAAAMGGRKTFRIHVVDSPYHRNLWFMRSIQYYRRCWVNSLKLSTAYEAKLSASMTQLFPAIARTSIKGIYGTKPEAITWAKEFLGHCDAIRWLEQVSLAREKSFYYTPDQKTKNAGHSKPDQETPVSQELSRVMIDHEWKNLQLADAFLGFKTDYSRVPVIKKQTNFPKEISRPEYNRVIELVTSKLRDVKGIRGICQAGTINAPGLSDLDLIILTDNALTDTSVEQLNHFYKDLDPKAKRVMMHPPMAIVPFDMLSRLPWLFPASVTNVLYGSIPDLKPVPRTSFGILQLIILTDLALAMNCRILIEMKRRKTLDIRLSLNALNGLRYTLNLLVSAGGSHHSSHLLNSIEEIRKNWFQSGQPDDLLNLIDKTLNCNRDINSQVPGLFERHSARIPDIKRFRARSTGVDFMIINEGDSSFYTEESEIILQLPRHFAVPLAHYAELKGPLSGFISDNLKGESVRQHGLLGDTLDYRGKVLNEHFDFLRSNKLKTGFFAPFHFGFSQ